MEAKTIQKDAVTADMTIGEIVSKHPESVQVMLSHGLHCIGCHVNIYETLEQGALGHGMTRQDVDNMTKEINLIIKNSNINPDKVINISDTAAKKIQELAKKYKKPGYGLRLAVTSGGCAGFSYAMDLEKSPSKDDIVIEHKKVKVFLTKADAELLKGSKIDYLESFDKSGFVVNNPNAHQTCSCGQSFH